ncbi:hypothetical protein [Actinophytocola algeriensis]|uniref:ABC transporter permease n=1 Tax=Actinophytocola algeriensis TaxID=1768010 RepID=A0A7W7Q704_9PSEU|nr:hypothetical protein [Actinophytocola algeriensis]MBB4908210.1 hypothetical protein [Actinophytocola algeriensis]MBE1480240.1 hypothetical protein [Actinophytocola algeriensis]
MSFGYLVVEVRRVLRSTRFLIFSMAFPVLLFLLYVGIFANGDRAVIGVLMVNMTAFGALSATLFAGGRLPLDRETEVVPVTELVGDDLQGLAVV